MSTALTSATSDAHRRQDAMRAQRAAMDAASKSTAQTAPAEQAEQAKQATKASPTVDVDAAAADNAARGTAGQALLDSAPRTPEVPLPATQAPATTAPASAGDAGDAADASGAAPAPPAGVPRTTTVAKGDTLTGIAQEHLKAAGFEAPTSRQVGEAVHTLASRNGLKDPNRIQAGAELKTPEALRQGQIFHRLAQGVTPGGESQYGMPAAGFSTEMASLVKDKDGLAGLAKEHGSAAVETMFNRHMAATGRSHITMDASGSPDNAINFTLKNSRDHFSMGTIASFSQLD